jgi:hypothetical protein
MITPFDRVINDRALMLFIPSGLVEDPGARNEGVGVFISLLGRLT